MNKSFFSSRKFKYGSAAVIATVVITVVVVLVNVVAGMLLDRYPLDIDLTRQKMFKLTQESIDFVREIDRDITIYMLAKESVYTSGAELQQANEIINQYSKYNNRIKVEYIDLTTNPSFPDNYPTLTLSNGYILVDGGTKQKLMNPNDLFNVESNDYGGYDISSKAEQVMTSALMNVTSGVTLKAVVLTDIGDDAAGLVTLMEGNNYEVVTRSLINEDIDKDADILVLSGPTRDLTTGETAKLDEFLRNGDEYEKTLLYFAGASRAATPNLDAFLREWGIAVEKSYVVETNMNRVYNWESLFYLDDSTPASYMSVIDYSEEEYSANLLNKNLYLSVPASAPVNLLYETSAGGYSAMALAGFTNTAYALYFNDANADETVDAADENTETDIQLVQGPFHSIVMSERTVSAGSYLVSSQVVVTGSNNAISESLLTSADFANAEYYINLLNSLRGNDQSIVIAPKEFTATDLTMTAGQTNVMFAIFVVVIPLAVMAFGMVLWVRRRTR